MGIAILNDDWDESTGIEVSNSKTVKHVTVKKQKNKDVKLNCVTDVKLHFSGEVVTQCENEQSAVCNTPSTSQSYKTLCTGQNPIEVPVIQTDTDFVNVKFTLDSGQNFACAFRKSITIDKIRELLADVLDVDKQAIKLKIGKRMIPNYLDLACLVTEPLITVNIRVESTDGATAVVEEKVRQNIPSLDVITVHLPQDQLFNTKNVVVEIENQCCQKEWLGGYRHKVTGVHYHNAFTLTKPSVKQVYDHSQPNLPVPLFFHRDTQTPYPLKEVAISTVFSRGTQMWRSDHYTPCKTDKILTARPYQSISNIRRSLIEKKVIFLQRTVREWLSGRKFSNLIKLEKQLLSGKRNLVLQMLTEQGRRERTILTSAVYPTRRDDFYVLYLMVDKWLKKDWKRIFSNRTEVGRKSCRYFLLQNEVKFLFAIEKQRIKVKEESLKKEEMRFLQMTARPQTFKNSKGQITSIEDLDTQRAGEFKEIYSQLITKNTKPSDRIDFLTVFKQLFTLHYKNYEFANDIIFLVDREIDLISIGTKGKDLKGLKMRIEQLFLNFLRQKEFNPRALKYKRANSPKTIDRLFLCIRCKKLLPPSKFVVHSRMHNYNQCLSCEWLHNIGHNRIDMGPSLKLLRQLQRSEMEKCCSTSVCFLLQHIGMNYLTNVIWHGYSIISGCKDLNKLQHVRWVENEEWAPWNTILLTNQEAKYHNSIPDVFKFYDKLFIEKVQRKNMTAKLHFRDLQNLDFYLRRDGEWQNINDSGPYFHPSHADRFATENDYKPL